MCAGGGGGSPWSSNSCTDGITKFTIQSGGAIDAFHVPNCGDNDTGARSGGGGGSLQKYTCPYPMVATGLTGRSGKSIDNLSVQCGNICAYQDGTYLGWQKCKDWCKNNSGQCTTALNAYCNNNKVTDEQCQPYVCGKDDGSFLSKPECRRWCVQNPGKCDAAAEAYCKANRTDTEFCGCYNIQKDSNSKLENVFALPQCYLQQCAGSTNAYKTAAYSKPASCPPLTICSADINQTAGGNASVKGVTIIQNCGADAKTNTTATGGTTGGTAAGAAASGASGTAAAAKVTEPATSNRNTILTMVGVGFLVIIICMLLSVVMTG